MEKIALRIDSNTVILVSPEKATEQYKLKYIQRLREARIRFEETIGGTVPQIDVKNKKH
jgi:hypothetical protein